MAFGPKARLAWANPADILCGTRHAPPYRRCCRRCYV